MTLLDTSLPSNADLVIDEGGSVAAVPTFTTATKPATKTQKPRVVSVHDLGERGLQR